MKTFIFILSFVSTLASAQEFSLVKSGKLYAAQKISSPKGVLVYRQLLHPTWDGGGVVDASGNETLGLLFPKPNEVVPATNRALRDAENFPVLKGSFVTAQIHVGRRLKVVEAEVLINFENENSLICFDPEFALLVKESSLPHALNEKGYGSLRLVLTKNITLVK